MLNYRIDIKQDPRLNAARMEKVTDKEIEAGLTEMGALLERLVAEHAPVGVFGARGGFKGSIFAELRGIPVRELLVGSTALHAPFVERGRMPGRMPPGAPIRLWVEKKLGLRGKEARSVTFLIQRAIGRRGTSGAAPFYRAFTEGRPILERIANKMGGKIVAEWEK